LYDPSKAAWGGAGRSGLERGLELGVELGFVVDSEGLALSARGIRLDASELGEQGGAELGDGAAGAVDVPDVVEELIERHGSP